MRQLRFVRLSEDGTQLVVQTSDGSEQFGIVIDAELRDAARGDLPQPVPADPPRSAQALAAAPAPEPSGPIVPREIQVRVRAGESPEEVAESLGVPVERIMRFAGPVVEERRRIADEARRARARHTAPEGVESRLVVFGETVDARFSAHGIDPAEVTWNARRREDGEWLVVAEWLGGGVVDGRHDATWAFARGTRTVTPVDDTAADLLSDRPIRPVAPPPPPTPRLVAAPPLVPGVVAFPPMPDAVTGPLPVVEDVFDQEAAPDGPRAVPPFVPAPAPVGREQPAAAASGPDVDFDAPPLPLGIAEPPAEPAEGANLRRSGIARLTNRGASKREESDEEKAARARVPSWDDILLGVRRNTD
ncbi:MAG TPA: septation protein SepH [Jatrophihabitans sp.]|nr:septation protein SepH [Jatrophihabitans sp.]